MSEIKDLSNIWNIKANKKLNSLATMTSVGFVSVDGTRVTVDSKGKLSLGEGTPIIPSLDVGSSNTPIYVASGTIKPLESTIGDGSSLVYMENGSFIQSTKTIGSPNEPLYVNNGVFEVANGTVSVFMTGACVGTGLYTLGGTSFTIISKAPDGVIGEDEFGYGVSKAYDTNVSLKRGQTFETLYMKSNSNGQFTQVTNIHIKTPESESFFVNELASGTTASTSGTVTYIIKRDEENRANKAIQVRGDCYASTTTSKGVTYTDKYIQTKINSSNCISIYPYNLVTTDTTQEISGSKTFTSDTTFSGNIILKGDAKIKTTGTNSFTFTATDGSKSCSLIGTADGKLTWGGNRLLKASNDTFQSGSVIYRHDDNTALAFCSGTSSNSSDESGAMLWLTGSNTGYNWMQNGSFRLYTANPSYILAGNHDGTLTWSGTFSATKVYNSVWNDYAEFFERGEETEDGDIIALSEESENEVYVKADENSKFVVGVQSDSYAHIIGGSEEKLEDNLKNFIPVGLSGRVFVKFIGKCSKGDYVVPSSMKGVGRLYDPSKDSEDKIIGRIVSCDSSDDLRKVRILINTSK